MHGRYGDITNVDFTLTELSQFLNFHLQNVILVHSYIVDIATSNLVLKERHHGQA